MPGAKSPQIRWDDNTWFVTLPLEDGKTVEANWKPKLTYVVRIREAGGGEWSFGFETPIASFTFVDLKPDTEYELEVRGKSSAGMGPPAIVGIRTGPTGVGGTVIPFPKQ